MEILNIGITLVTVVSLIGKEVLIIIIITKLFILHVVSLRLMATLAMTLP